MRFVPRKMFQIRTGGRVSGGKYACLASSPAQAFYWAEILKERTGGGKWYIYEIRLPHEYVVENCEGGYHFEGVGKLQQAVEVFDHRDVDGEICIFEPAQVSGVHAIIDFTPRP